MKVPKELTTVTPLSRIVAVIVIIAIMIIGFGLGINYQEGIDLLKKQNNPQPTTISNPTTLTDQKKDCRATGCSGEICHDEEVATTCVVSRGDECYKNARCERQTGGKCGWTQTSELLSCLTKAKK